MCLMKIFPVLKVFISSKNLSFICYARLCAGYFYIKRSPKENFPIKKKSVPCTLKTMITKHTLKVNAEINVFLHFLHFHEEIISFKNAPAFLLRGARHAIA